MPSPSRGSRPGRVAVLVGAGGVCSAVAVIAGGRSYTAKSSPPTHWFGLLSATGYAQGDVWWAGGMTFAALAGLVACWLGLLAVVARRDVAERTLWRAAALWVAPLAVGPPLLSKDIYAYAGQAALERAGRDSYRDSPFALLSEPHGKPFLNAIDVRWRDVRSPYGPLLRLLERGIGVAGHGDALTVLLLFRLVALIAVGVVAWGVVSLAADRPRAVCLAALNPLLLVHGVSAAHVDALICALVVGALVCVRRGRPMLGVALLGAGALVKVPVAAAVPLVVLAVICGREWRTPWSRAGYLIGLVGAAALPTVACAVLMRDPWGWLANLNAPLRGGPDSSLSSALGEAVASATGIDAAVSAIRYAGLGVAAGLVGLLALTIRRRPVEASVGLGLLAVAALSPVTYPWYLMWGLCCLMAVPRVPRQRAVVALSGAMCTASVPGLPSHLALALTLTEAALVVAAVWWRPAPSDAPAVRRTAAGPAVAVPEHLM